MFYTYRLLFSLYNSESVIVDRRRSPTIDRSLVPFLSRFKTSLLYVGLRNARRTSRWMMETEMKYVYENEEVKEFMDQSLYTS